LNDVFFDARKSPLPTTCRDFFSDVILDVRITQINLHPNSFPDSLLIYKVRSNRTFCILSFFLSIVSYERLVAHGFLLDELSRHFTSKAQTPEVNGRIV